MADVKIEDAIKSRIESLTHTRQYIVILGSIITGLYVLAGKEFIGNLKFTLVHTPPWSCLIFSIAVSIILADISFILSIFLLTDSIHNYSKVLEYSCNSLFERDDGKKEAALSHNRALVSDDLSYFFARIGTLLLIFNLFVALWFIISKKYFNIEGFYALLSILICFGLSIWFVSSAYYVAHYKMKIDSKRKSDSESEEDDKGNQYWKNLWRFWGFWKWVEAWRGSGDIHQDGK